MCLTIPGQITAINNGVYKIKYETQEAEVNNSMIEGLKVGDWVIVQNKFIMQQLSDQQAKDFFDLLK